MFRVGLTGNIASGKSAVAGVWRELGAVVVDADELARRAVEPGSPGLRCVVEAFGVGVLRADGSLDRSALRAIVFADPDRRRALERILHPEIGRLRILEEQRLERAGQHVVVHMIPLLFEASLADEFDEVVLVDSPEETRLRRLIEKRGLEEEEARRMISSQLPTSMKRAGATIVIDNDGTLEQLEERATHVWREIEQRAG